MALRAPRRTRHRTRRDHRPDPAPARCPSRQPPGDAYRAFPLKGAAGRQLQDQGPAVTLLVDEDPESFDVTASIQATNPDHPERGTVNLNDLADIDGDYSYRDDPATRIAAVADTVIPILCDGIGWRRPSAHR